MVDNKKWTDNSLVLDPESVSKSRKLTQKKFASKTKLIKRFFYVGLGLVVVVLSITLPLVLTGNSNDSSPSTKTYPRQAIIANPKDIIVKFNTNILEDDETNPNDYKKEKLFDKIKSSMSGKVSQDVYYAIINSELNDFDKLGNFNTIVNFVQNQIIQSEEDKAQNEEKSYLYQLMERGFGTLNAALTNEAQLEEAKRQYVESYEMRSKVFGYVLSMIYLASSEVRFKNAAKASSLKELWYLKTAFSDTTKDEVIKNIYSKSCRNLPEVPILWGRVSFNNFDKIISKENILNIFKNDFDQAEDIRTVLFSDILVNNSLNNTFLKQLIDPKIIDLIKRSTKDQVINAMNEPAAKTVFELTSDLNSSTSWNTIRKHLYTTAFKNMLAIAKDETDFKENFVDAQLNVFNKRIDAQSNLYDYAVNLGLNPEQGSTDSDLRILIKDGWRNLFSDKYDEFVQTEASEFDSLTQEYWDNVTSNFPVDEVAELKEIFNEFVPLATIDQLGPFLGNHLENDESNDQLLELYNGDFLSQIITRVSQYLDETYSETQKKEFVAKYKDNLALDDNAWTWKRLSVFITRVLVWEYIQLLKNADSRTAYLNLEENKISSSISSWNEEKLRNHLDALQVSYNDTDAKDVLEQKITTSWNNKNSSKVTTFVNTSKANVRSEVIENLFQNIPPKKDCGSLDNWNSYVLDSSINKDEKYFEKREEYGLAEERKFGYMGFVRQSSAPSEITSAMKSIIFRSTIGTRPFVDGLQVREDFDGKKRPYFISSDSDGATASFVIAKSADENKYKFSSDQFDLEYAKHLLFAIVSTSSSSLSNARRYYFTEKKYRVFFYDDGIKGALGGAFNPNNVKNPTKNSAQDPTKDTN